MAKNKPWKREKWEEPTQKRRGGLKQMRPIPVSDPASPTDDTITFGPSYPTVYTYPTSSWMGLERDVRRSPFTKGLVERLAVAEPREPRKPSPDYIEPIVAWRAWGITSKGGEWRLNALGLSGIWEPKQPIAADCKINERQMFYFGPDKPKHCAPDFKCECGIWSFRSLEILLDAMKEYDNAKVIGQVSIWGRVIECENGYRSQFAYPKELWLLDESMEQLGYIYGVPIRTAGGLK